MADHYLIFDGQSVRDMLAGRKTQTRRALDPQPESIAKAITASMKYAIGDRICVKETFVIETNQEYREMWQAPTDGRPVKTCDGGFDWGDYELIPHYRATEPEPYITRDADDPRTKWSSPIFMPRWASRITLTVTGGKIERVQDISPEDARDEGVDRRSKKVRQFWLFGASQAEADRIYLQACPWEYRDRWEAINGKRKDGRFSWENNPWVRATTFQVHRVNIDQMTERAA